MNDADQGREALRQAHAVVKARLEPEVWVQDLGFELGWRAALTAREDWIAERSDVEKERDELRAKLAAREEPTRLDEVVISREEFEQIRRSQSFTQFVAALDRPVAADARRKITLERLIEKAKAALVGAAAREDTERPAHETLEPGDFWPPDTEQERE